MIWDELNKPFFVMAPMDDVTDTVFRRIIASTAAPDLYYSEFASVDGFMSQGKQAVEEKLRFTSFETPLIAQIWGLVPDNYEATGKELTHRGFAGVDINMGCPQKKVIKNGACSALINNRPLAKDIIDATRRGLDGKLPLSVKTRIGFNEIDMSWTEFLLEQSLDALIIHGRTSKEQSRVPNHWDKIAEVVAQRDKISPKTLIVGNGDILTRQQGLEMANKYGVNGLMIGRGVFKDPYVFAEESDWASESVIDKMGLFAKHINLFIEEWGEKRNPASLKKFAKVYVSGFDGASELRSQLMQCSTAEEMLQQIT